MLAYSASPTKELFDNVLRIFSFLDDSTKNIDPKTVESFGGEWTTFQTFSKIEIEKIGADYFDLLPKNSSEFAALDVGCGSGRWAAYLANKVKFIEAIDPRSTVFIAHNLAQKFNNIRVTHASVNTIPFEDNSFDLVYSLGFLHHVLNTDDAVFQCFKKVKNNGYFLLYLYYNLENRGKGYKLLFAISNVVRLVISQLPATAKKILCDLLAALFYWPLAKLNSVISLFSKSFAQKLPLSYYKKTSFFIMRNDALDRFGTPLEKRFSKKEISELLVSAGFINIQFPENEPYWHVIAQKP